MSGQRIFRRFALVVACVVVVGLCQPADAFLALQNAMQNESIVAVGRDGTGVTTATFPTTVGGEEVRYVLLVQNGLTGRERQAPPVQVLEVEVNAEHVYDNTNPAMAIEKIEIALLPPGELNTITLRAYGEPGSAARVTIVALDRPVTRWGGRSVLPWAWTEDLTTTILVLHNAGPSSMAARLNFYNPGGSLAGRSEPILLTKHDTVKNSINNIVAQQGIPWIPGTIEIEWVSPAESRMSSVAVVRMNDCEGYACARELAIDDYGPFPIGRAEFEALWGQLPPG